VAQAVSTINGTDAAKLYADLLAVAKTKTAQADVKLDDRGRPILDEEEELDLGKNCIIVSAQEQAGGDAPPSTTATEAAPVGKPKSRQRGKASLADEGTEPRAEPAEKKPAKASGKTAKRGRK